MKKTKLIILTASLIFVVSGGFVYAIDYPSATNTANTTKDSNSTSTSAGSFFNVDEINKFFKEASNSANRQEIQLQNVIKAADAMIANRISTLNALKTRIDSDKRLTADEKTSLTSDVQTTITGLNSLKTTIDADTDLAKAKADTKLIVTNYYVYAFLEPKLRMLITLNNLQTTSSNISSLLPQVQDLVTKVGGQGKDVSGLNTILVDISSQLSSVNATIASDISLLNGVTASSSNAKDILAQVKTDLNTIVKTDFVKIREDFKQLRNLFHQTITGSTSSPEESESPHPSPTGI